MLDRSRTMSYSPRQSVNFDTIGEYHMPDGRATYKNLKIALINRDETLTLLAAHLQTSIPQVHRIVLRCHGKAANQLTATERHVMETVAAILSSNDHAPNLARASPVLLRLAVPDGLDPSQS